MNSIEKMNKYVMPTYGRYQISLQSGKDENAVDETEIQYIDFGSGIGTNSLGFCNENWVNAVCSQAQKLQHTSNYYYTAVQGDFAEKLCQKTGFVNAFFGNSGAEANECAIKIARKYSFDKYGADANRNTIITLENSFHGRTLTTLSATGQDVFHNYFFPFTPGFKHTPPNNLMKFEESLDDTVCAIMIEFIQGEGGVLDLDENFVKAIFDICAERDILIIADEVQTGVMRTGKFLAAEYYGVKPDITTLAKGIAGGLPMGVCLAGEKCKSVLGKSDHGSTFGGNPICCAAGNAVLDTVCADGFEAEVLRKGELFRKLLSEIPEVESISGKGLMIGIKFKSLSASEIAAKCHENGLLVLTAKDKLRFLPPLTVTDDEIKTGIEILKKCIGGQNS
ncbi:MAG: acetylornithine/succinylornithine family transaminase [Ruminococcus sp.]|jgi:acetylornithine/N-succinyldiaminopimelate aminotransferase|nr:acetylornithine/succinylornithine family transaminase [Ruminococcus sp.]